MEGGAGELSGSLGREMQGMESLQPSSRKGDHPEVKVMVRNVKVTGGNGDSGSNPAPAAKATTCCL